MQSYGLPVGREVIDTVVWIGRFIESANVESVWPVFRPAVRAHFVGIAKKGQKSGDKAIHHAMLNRYGPIQTKGITKDQWSALAVATYVADKQAAGTLAPRFPLSMLHERDGSAFLISNTSKPENTKHQNTKAKVR